MIRKQAASAHHVKYPESVSTSQFVLGLLYRAQRLRGGTQPGSAGLSFPHPL
ncbi:MAG: hypothetical protein WCA59_05665 [Candidatus Binataceae bacterium]